VRNCAQNLKHNHNQKEKCRFLAMTPFERYADYNIGYQGSLNYLTRASSSINLEGIYLTEREVIYEGVVGASSGSH
jgi:hypothetical protein